MATEVSAQDVCHQLMYELRMSNLHFTLSQTPYSVQIVIRKHFLKDKKVKLKFLHRIFKGWKGKAQYFRRKKL